MYSLQLSVTSCPSRVIFFLSLDPTPESHIAYICHVSLVSFNLKEFLNLYLF